MRTVVIDGVQLEFEPECLGQRGLQVEVRPVLPRERLVRCAYALEEHKGLRIEETLELAVVFRRPEVCHPDEPQGCAAPARRRQRAHRHLELGRAVRVMGCPDVGRRRRFSPRRGLARRGATGCQQQDKAGQELGLSIEVQGHA